MFFSDNITCKIRAKYSISNRYFQKTVQTVHPTTTLVSLSPILSAADSSIYRVWGSNLG